MIEWDEDGDMQTLVDEILKILPRRIGDAPLFTTRQGKRATVVQPPGSISPHLAAQAGLFTVHPHDGSREKPFKVFGLENQFSILPYTPLMKLTIPVQESARLHWLCAKIGITGASIYPGADGAGRTVINTVNSWAAARYNSLYKSMNQNIKQS